MSYHLVHWEYFIELSCFNPDAAIEILVDSAEKSIENMSAYTLRYALNEKLKIVNCARTMEGLESILLNIIGKALDGIKPKIFDDILKETDERLFLLKNEWAYDHKYSE